MLSHQIELSECPPQFVDGLVLEPCLFLENLPVVASCNVSGDEVSVKFTSPVEHSCVYKLHRKDHGWRIILKEGPEPRPSGYLQSMGLLYLGGAFLRVEAHIAGGFLSRRSVEKMYTQLISNYSLLARGRCRKVDIAERITRVKREFREEKPFWEALPTDIKVDLSLTLVRAALLREVEKVYASNGVPQQKYMAEKAKTGDWLIVVIYPNGREYILVSNGLIKGRHLEGAKGPVVQSIFYKLKKSEL
uniref:Uncharacterized protein n=1 Tax=Thermogladius calderae TaxID=1200300 RepID=A0A7J3XY36_9CREN